MVIEELLHVFVGVSRPVGAEGLIAPVDPKATPFEPAHDVLADLVPAADPRALPLLPEDPRPALVDTVTSPEALMATPVPAEAAPLAGPRKRRRRLHGFSASAA